MCFLLFVVGIICPFLSESVEMIAGRNPDFEVVEIIRLEIVYIFYRI
jgi:hypothetical protein